MGFDARINSKDYSAVVNQNGQRLIVMYAGHNEELVYLDPLHAGDGQDEVTGKLTAPMPGKVVSFAVKAGDKVKIGQTLAVLEAMKMEHTIAAPADGVVGELLYAPGDQVPEGAELLKLVVG